MKIAIMSDSFKGTMSSALVNQIIESALKTVFFDAAITTVAMADGGEGSVDAFCASVKTAKQITIKVSNPKMEPIGATYAIDEQTAFIEMASAAGLTLVKQPSNPAYTTTYGVGELMLHALSLSVKEIVIGLGGSATNDCGCGCLSACGVTFYDENDLPFVPVGATLKHIKRIDKTLFDQRFKDVKLTIISDVNNPLTGDLGAAKVFAKQKGADDNTIEALEAGAMHFASIIQSQFNVDPTHLAAAGAAGGMGAGLQCFFNATVKSGIDYFLSLVNFDELLPTLDYIFTGEGKLDKQTALGKVVYGIGQKAKDAPVKVIAVVGKLDPQLDFVELGVDEVIIIHQKDRSWQEILVHAESDCRIAIEKWAQQNQHLQHQ